MAASVLASPNYDIFYEGGMLNTINDVAALSINAYTDVNDQPRNLVVGASSNVNVEAVKHINLTYSESGKLSLYNYDSTDYNTKYEILNISNNYATSTTTIMAPDMKLAILGSDQYITTSISQTSFSTVNNYQTISTDTNGFIFDDYVKFNSNLVVEKDIMGYRNLAVAGNMFSRTMNLYKNVDPSSNVDQLSQVAYAFYINQYNQLELIRYEKFGTSNVSTVQKRLNVWGATNKAGTYVADVNSYTVLTEFNGIVPTNAADSNTIGYTDGYTNNVSPGGGSGGGYFLRSGSNVFLMRSNVGIGMSNPVYSLDVAGAIQAIGYCNLLEDSYSSVSVYKAPTSSNFTYAYVKLVSTSNIAESATNTAITACNIGISASNTAITACNIANSASNTAITACNIANSALTLSTSNSNIFNNTLVNTTSSTYFVKNKVGVANTDPETALHVGGDIYATAQYFANDASGTQSIPNFSFKGASNTGMYLASNNTIGFTTNGSEKMRINSAGNIGIGTSTPASKVDVNGAIQVRNGNANTSSTNNQLVFGYANTATYNHAIKTRHYSTTDNSENAIDFYLWQTSDNSNSTGSKQVMSVTSVGVGVGTSTPTAMLDVNGSARIASNLSIIGDLNVLGTTTTINATNVNITDNLIKLNNGAAYNVGLQAGIEVNRGTGYCNYMFVFDEATDYFKVGESLNLQTVATREDIPSVRSIPYYDASSNRYASASTFVYDAGKVGIGIASPSSALHVVGTITGTNVAGNGSGLTSLNATNISTGTLSVGLGGTGATTTTGTGSNVLNTNPLFSTQLSVSSAENNTMFSMNGLITNNPVTVDPSFTNTGMIELSTRNAGNTGGGQTKLNIGVYNQNTGAVSDYAYLQCVNVSHYLANIVLQPKGGNVGISTSNPTETLQTNGKIYTTVQFLSTSNDSSSLPSYSFKEDSNTGIFHPSTQALGFTTGGAERVRVTNTGLGVGRDPVYPLDTSGIIRTSSYFLVNNGGNNQLLMNSNEVKFIGAGTAHYSIFNSNSSLMFNNTSANTAIGTSGANIMTMTVNGGVGIGTTSPNSVLHLLQNQGPSATPTLTLVGTSNTIATDNKVELYTRLSQGAYNNIVQDNDMGIIFNSTLNNGNFVIAPWTAGPAGIRITSNGNVGIGTANPTYKLHVVGDIYATSEVIAYSDSNVKTNLQVIDNAVNKINQVNGYTFTRTDLEDKEKRYTGVIAQEIQKILPEAVHKDDNDRLSVAYGNLAGLFIEAIKELKRDQDSMKEELKELRSKLLSCSV